MLSGLALSSKGLYLLHTSNLMTFENARLWRESESNQPTHFKALGSYVSELTITQSAKRRCVTVSYEIPKMSARALRNNTAATWQVGTFISSNVYNCRVRSGQVHRIFISVFLWPERIGLYYIVPILATLHFSPTLQRDILKAFRKERSNMRNLIPRVTLVVNDSSYVRSVRRRSFSVYFAYEQLQ